ncbi:histone-lysine N-methyltransferase ASH1L-like isoform X2 [Trichomycterus rosablanca]|uniref:histone-lysine N-methyltransferase ASH1L-like isoform X2 n=1 Tax=Trichomycterus rosablanca TaxID=2290929 RepID=UPI002F35EC91
MDKKRKSDSSATASEANDQTESRKRLRSTKPEAPELDSPCKETDGKNKKPQDLSEVKETGCSEGNVKVKTRLGTKRTKKPPKSLENFICRPSIRVFQKPEPLMGLGICKGRESKSSKPRGHHSLQKKCDPDTFVTNEKSSSTTKETSTLSDSPLPTSVASLASDSQSTVTAKKVLRKQTKIPDLKSEVKLGKAEDAVPPHSSRKLPFTQKINPVTSIKQTHSSKPTSSESHQEDISILNADITEQGQASPNTNHGNPSKNAGLRSEKSVSSTLTTCLLRKAVKNSETGLEMPSDLHLSETGSEGCVKDSLGSHCAQKKHQNGSIQQPSANDLPKNPTSSQVTDSLNSSIMNSTSDLIENSSRKKGKNESKDQNDSSELTAQSLQQNPVEQKKFNTDRADKHGKKIRHSSEQAKANCSADATDASGSTINTKKSAAPVKPLIDASGSKRKPDKKCPDKQKVQHPHDDKTAKATDEIKNSSDTTVQKGSQNENPFLKTSKELSTPRHELNLSAQPPKSKPSRNSTHILETSSLNEPQPRKRGRPKMTELKVDSQPIKSQLFNVNPPNNQTPQVQDSKIDLTQTEPVAKKRGRPKQSFSLHAKKTQSAVQDAKDLCTKKTKKRDLEISKKRKKVAMKTIIKHINKIKAKRKDQIFTQVLLGQKQCDDENRSQQSTETVASSPVSPSTDSLSSLVSSFGGKLSPQINISKRGTIYMGKKRGRKPKYQGSSCIPDKQHPSAKSQEISPDVPRSNYENSLKTQSVPLAGSSRSLKHVTSALSPETRSLINTQKVKATSFMQLSEQLNSKAHCEATFTRNNDNTTEGNEFHSTLTTGSVFTQSGVPGTNPFKGRTKTFSTSSSEHLFSSQLPVQSGRPQDFSETTQISPLLTFTDQEGHKFKCHRKAHHCLSHEKLRRHKTKCKKKYVHLKAKRQDPDFLAKVEDLVIRLKKVHIVQQMNRTRLGDTGRPAGRKALKGNSQSCDFHCVQEKVHPQTMLQINLSGYYSPNSAVSCEPLHYVRMANMSRKHDCSARPCEQMVNFPVMPKVGYPLPGSAFIHPSYKVPFTTTTSLGFGLYRGYPSAALYPVTFPPSYMHHYSKTPIISPSKFHKRRRTKFPRQDPLQWGQNSFGGRPKMTQRSSCGCFNTQSLQKEKQKDKSRAKREEQSRTTERQHGTADSLWTNRNFNDSGNSGDSSFNSPSSTSSIFSQTKDKTFSFTNPGPLNQGQHREVRCSGCQPSWGCDNRNFEPEGNEDTQEESETDEVFTSTQQPHLRSQSVFKQSTFSKTQSQKRTAKTRHESQVESGDSDVSMEEDEFTPEDQRASGFDLAGGSQFPRKHQCPNSSSSREPQETQSEPRTHKANSLHLNQSKTDQVSQSSPHTHQPTRNTASASGKRHNLKSPKNKGIQKPAVPASNNLKRRGPGRPRKNPEPSHPPSVPELATFLTEEMDKSEKGGNENMDTVMEVIELVIQGEQRSPNKRMNEVKEKNGGQEQKKDTDGTMRSLDFHTPLSPLAPSPAQVEERQPEKGSASPPSKKYLWAGLYSDVYKNENVPDEPQQLSIDCLEFNPEDHDHGLLPAPLHVGKYLRLKRIDFQLPYDIYWLCAHNKLFEMPVTPPQPESNSPSKPSDSSFSQSSSDEPHTSHAEYEDQADGHTYQCSENHPHHQLLTQQEGNWDNENFPSPLSSEERSFVIKHGVFLMRNYKKMKVRQALLLRGGAEEQEKEEDKPDESSEDGAEDPTIMSGARLSTGRVLKTRSAQHTKAKTLPMYSRRSGTGLLPAKDHLGKP